jgi:hypothetical protein
MTAALPPDVFVGMYVAAWCRAETCPLSSDKGELYMWTRYAPSDELAEAFRRERGKVEGVLGFGVPVRPRPSSCGVRLTGWPLTFGDEGRDGAN